jgi:uncharacterized protein (DUF305 family)
MFRDLIGRTVVMLSLATALVALSIALDLPRTGAADGAHPVVIAHGGPAAADAMAHAPVANEADFVAGMIPHHQEAVDVAREVLELAQRAEVRELAAAIVATQQEEIDQLAAWLAAWYPDAPAATYTPMMRTLTGLTPAEVDLVFVTDMIHHHEMAVTMAEETLALDPAPRPEVAALAREVVRVQADEIATLRGWLAAWGAPAPASPTGGH